MKDELELEAIVEEAMIEVYEKELSDLPLSLSLSLERRIDQSVTEVVKCDEEGMKDTRLRFWR